MQKNIEQNAKNNFNFKKKFGQNFIFDKNFLKSLVESFDVPHNAQILEIGAGMGTLTEVLAQKYARVVSYEIDDELRPFHQELSKKFDNITFVYKDILQEKTNDIDNMFDKNYFLIANLPYYITSQIVFKFLLEAKHMSKMFVMVQKEVGERFCATKGKERGVPSVLIDTFANAKIAKFVPKSVFTPQPKVDSCIVEIDINKKKFDLPNVESYADFVANCFAMKRKTILNNLLSCGHKKDVVEKSLSKHGILPTMRPEQLCTKNFVDLFFALHNQFV